MTSLQEVRRVVQARLDKFQPAQRSWDAYLGDGNGTINDESQPFHTYVRYPAANSPATSITNTRVPAQIENLRIKVGYLPEQPTLLQVLSVVPDQRLDDAGSLALIPTHAPTHTYGGSDPVYIVWRQIGDFRLYAMGGLQVTLQGGIATIAGTVTTISTQVIDLTDSVPATGARWSLISVDSAGKVNVTDGTPQTTATALTFAHIPATPSGEWRIWAIKLQASQTVIDESRLFVDTLDLRWPQNLGAGSVALSDLAAGSAQYQYLTTGATPFTPAWSSGFLNITAAKTLSATGTLTLTPSSDGLTLTVPATGTAALGAGTLTVSTTNDVTGATHTHAVTTSADVSAGASAILASSSGLLTVKQLGVGAAALSNVSTNIAGTITSANNAFGVYMGQIVLTPATANNAYFQYVGGGTVATGAANTVNLAAALYCETLQKSGTGTITNTYAVYALKSTVGTNNYGAYFGGNVGILDGTPAYSLSVGSGYAYLNGLRISGGDTGNTIWQSVASANMALTANGGAITLGQTSGAHLTIPSTGLTTLATTSASAGILSTLTLANLGSGANGDGGSIVMQGKSSTTAAQGMAALKWLWVDATHATRKADLVLSAYDTAEREGLRIRGDGSAAAIGFLGAAPIAAYSSTGDIRQALIDFGLVTTGGASPLDLNGGLLTAGSIAQATLKASGVHKSTSITYISGTGTAGTDNTAQTVKSLTLAANTLTQVGDRLRIRAYWTGDTGSPITGSCLVGPAGSEVLVSHTTDAGGATLQLNEVWLHYIDNTHANIIENEAGALGALSAPNVAGFTWNASQAIIFTQDAIANNHTIIYALIVDVFPKGV